jgi:hypothetical protein
MLRLACVVESIVFVPDQDLGDGQSTSGKFSALAHR